MKEISPTTVPRVAATHALTPSIERRRIAKMLAVVTGIIKKILFRMPTPNLLRPNVVGESCRIANIEKVPSFQPSGPINKFSLMRA